MNEWTIITTVIALVGFIITVIKTILPLNTAITELTQQVKMQNTSLKELTTDNSEGHKRLWAHNTTQDKTLYDHETRIVVLERTKKE